MKKASKVIEFLLAGALAISPLACSANQAPMRAIREHERTYSLDTAEDNALYEQKWIKIFGESYITRAVDIADPNYLDFIIAPIEDTSTEYSSSIVNHREPKFADDAKTIFNRVYVPKKTEFGAHNIRETEINRNDSEKFRAIESIIRENPHNRLNKYEMELAKTRYFHFEPHGTDKRVSGKLPTYFMFYDETSLKENNDSGKITAIGDIYRPVEITREELERLTSSSNERSSSRRRDCASIPRVNCDSFTAINGDTIWHDWCSTGLYRGFPRGNFNDYKNNFIRLNTNSRFNGPNEEGLITGQTYQRPRR